MLIETQNLKLIPCDTELLEIALAGNELLSKKLNVIVPQQWTEFGDIALQYSLNKLSENEEEQSWWTYFPIHKQDNILIGSCGYKGKPDEKGLVEIGYEITTDYRNRGLATELTKGLVDNAFKDPRVKAIIAHTLGNENPSTKVLQKNAFIKVDEIEDPEDGLIWKWELK